MCSKYNNRKTLSIWEIKTILKKLSFYIGFRFRRSNAHALEMKQGQHIMAPRGVNIYMGCLSAPGIPESSGTLPGQPNTSENVNLTSE